MKMTEYTGNIEYEETLWKAADKFETEFNALIEEGGGFEEDRDEYEEENSLPALKENLVENFWHLLS